MKFEKDLTQGNYLEIVSDRLSPEVLYKQLERNGTLDTFLSLKMPKGEERKLFVEIKEEERPKGEITILRKRKNLEKNFEKDPSLEFCGFYPIQEDEQEDIYSEISRTLEFVEENIIKNLPKTKIPIRRVIYNPKDYANLQKNKDEYTADIELELKFKKDSLRTLQDFFEDALSSIQDCVPLKGVVYLPFGIIMANFNALELSTATIESMLKKELKEKFYDAEFEGADFQKKLYQMKLIEKLKNSKKNLLNMMIKNKDQSTKSAPFLADLEIPELDTSKVFLSDFYNIFFTNRDNIEKLDNLRETLLMYENNQEILNIVREKVILKNIKVKSYNLLG